MKLKNQNNDPAEGKKNIEEYLKNKQNNRILKLQYYGDGIGLEISTVGVDVMTACMRKVWT